MGAVECCWAAESGGLLATCFLAFSSDALACSGVSSPLRMACAVCADASPTKACKVSVGSKLKAAAKSGGSAEAEAAEEAAPESPSW